MPSPRKGESKNDFMSRCMGNKESQNDFPDQDQRAAFCISRWEQMHDSSETASWAMDSQKFAVTSDGVFSGYAAYFDVEDTSGETFAPGAFKDTLEQQDISDIKLLWQHETDEVCGHWLEMREDKIGLFVRGQLNLDTECGQMAKSHLEGQEVTGLSVGFNVIESVGKRVNKAWLWEVSLVTFARQRMAKVDNMVYMRDLITIDAKPIRTKDGYLAFTARAARTGIQLYRGAEVGRPDLEVVRVYRPDAEVFSKDALRSMAHRPMTNDHPPVPVAADNWKSYAIGHTGDEVLRDGEFVRIPMVMMDQDAIKDYEGGKRELSMGYTCDLQWGGGRTPGGEEYDAIQTRIRANHMAVVAAARGGSRLRIGDDNEGATTMPKYTIDGIECEMTDVSHSVVSRAIKSLETQVTNLRSELDKEKKEREDEKRARDAATVETTTKLAAKDKEIEELTKRVNDSALTPSKLDAAVKDRAETIQKGVALIGDKLVTDGKSLHEIKKQVVDTIVGDAAKGWDETSVASSFATLSAQVKADALGTPSLADALSKPPANQQAATTAWNDRNKRTQDAWKGTQPASGRTN